MRGGVIYIVKGELMQPSLSGFSGSRGPRLAAVVAIVGALLFGASSLLHAATTYQLDDLKQLGANDLYGSQGCGISSNNSITGGSGIGSLLSEGFIWQNGAMNALPGLTAYGWSTVGYGINSSGTIVGTVGDGEGDGRAFLYKNGVTTDIGTFLPNAGGTDGYYGNAGASAINNNGIVVGEASGDLDTEVAMYYDGTLHALPGLPNTTLLDSATALNNQTPPEIVGDAWGPNDTERAVAWINGQIKDLGTLGGADAYATGVNNAGQIVGESEVPADHNGFVYYHAFLYTPGGTDGVAGNPQMKDLGLLPGGTYSGATSINNSGQVVGTADATGESSTGFIWDKVNGMQGLNPLVKTANIEIQPNIGWGVQSASAINDAGYITGTIVIFVDDDQGGIEVDHGFLMTPQGGAPGNPGAPGVPGNVKAKGVVKQIDGTIAPLGYGVSPNVDTLFYEGQVSWTNAVPDATHGAQTSVLIERKLSTAANTAYVQIGKASASAVSYIDTSGGMTPGNSYTYRLRAANTAGDSAYSHTYTFATAVAPISLVWASPSVVGGNSATGTITLSGPAPTGGQSVQIIEDTTSVGFITVPVGISSVGITLTSIPVKTSIKHVFGAKTNNITAKGSLTFTPATTLPKSISYSPNPLKGGGNSTGTIKLTNPAPTGGAVVTILLNGSNFYAVTVPAGATSVTYAQPTSVVTAKTTYVFGASYGGTTVTTSLVTTP